MNSHDRWSEYTGLFNPRYYPSILRYCENILDRGYHLLLGKKYKFVDSWIRGFEVFC